MNAMSVTLHTTEGDIKAELYCGLVPRSARNFLALCASGRYDGSHFHRALKSFMVQGGGVQGTRKSRAADQKRLPDEIVPALTFEKPGVIAYANKGAPANDGVGSQFFITLASASHLDATCTIFAHVIDGLQCAHRLADEVLAGNSPYINNVTIHANPFADEMQ